MKKWICIAVLFYSILSTCFIFSQENNNTQVSITSTNKNKIDSNYVKFYKDKLIVALWQSERSFDILLNQRLYNYIGTNTAVNYIANSNNVTGLSVDYDIIGLALGFRSIPSGDDRTGNSKYIDFGFNINTSGFRFENSYKRYIGFYDDNSANYIKPFINSTPYYQNPDLRLRVAKSKLLYTFNKRKFALSAAYANVKRQIRSQGSWIAVGNFYSFNFSTPSYIAPIPLKSFYGSTWGSFNKMTVSAFSAGFGATYTLVIFKGFYLNFLGSLGLERQYRRYYTYPDNKIASYWKTRGAADWRSSLGFNGKRFFIRISGIYDFNNYESRELEFKMQFYAASFDFGYRFNFKAPAPYKKFQDSNIYKRL